MQKLFFWLTAVSLFANDPKADTLYESAWNIIHTYQTQVAKFPEPSNFPQTYAGLEKSTSFLTIDLENLQNGTFAALANENLWDLIAELGVDSVYFSHLKAGDKARTGISLNPKWGSGWNSLQCLLEKRNLTQVGKIIGPATGLIPDFLLALKAVGNYQSMYHLVEINQRDWKNLPEISPSCWYANVPWLSLQKLAKKGYVSEKFLPYVKQSAWNATAEVRGVDGKLRRYIFLQDQEKDPMINWLGPAYTGVQLASADALFSNFGLGQSFLIVDGSIGDTAVQNISHWIRKLRCFSILDTEKGLKSYTNCYSDFIIDRLTPAPLLHALLAEDAEGLRLMYRLMLQVNFDLSKMVHQLHPLTQNSCEWAELIASPKKRFQYFDEYLTGEALRAKLMKEDLARLGPYEAITWPKVCEKTANLKGAQKAFDRIINLHSLLAFFYACQPGIFSISGADLVGQLSAKPINLLTPSENTLYGSLSAQSKNRCSFYRRIMHYLRIRKEQDLAKAALIGVPKTCHPALLILIFEGAQRKLQLLAINFSNMPLKQMLQYPEFSNTSAIDLLTNLAEEKPLNSSEYQLDIAPLSGKIVLFQPKYYD